MFLVTLHDKVYVTTSVHMIFWLHKLADSIMWMVDTRRQKFHSFAEPNHCYLHLVHGKCKKT